jgi:hypothetical protein
MSEHPSPSTSPSIPSGASPGFWRMGGFIIPTLAGTCAIAKAVQLAVAVFVF